MKMHLSILRQHFNNRFKADRYTSSFCHGLLHRFLVSSFFLWMVGFGNCRGEAGYIEIF